MDLVHWSQFSPTQLSQSLDPSGNPAAPLSMNEYEERTVLIYQLPSVLLNNCFSKSLCLFTSLSLMKTDPLSPISLEDEPGF